MPTPGLLDAIPLAAARLDSDGIVVEANAGWAALGAVGAVAAAGCGERWPPVGARVPSELGGVLAGDAPWAALHHAVEVDGAAHWFRLEVRACEGGGWVVTCADVSWHHEAIRAFRREARRDPLTGLLNRRALERRLARRIADDGSVPAMIAVLDLDNFKDVNDRFGHPIGDKVLQAVGERLTATLRENDAVARFGGDEFVALVHGIATPLLAEDVAERLRAAIESPLHIDGHGLRLRASIGTALLGADADVDADDAQAALTVADRRMYRDKARRDLVARRGAWLQPTG